MALAASGIAEMPSRATTTPNLLGKVRSVQQLANGVLVRSAGGTIVVTALQDGVLRVRLSREQRVSDDGSWSVLPSARTHSILVHTDSDHLAVGFHTALLQVWIARSDSSLSILDRQGQMLSADSKDRPVEFHGNSYQIYKDMPLDEHFFGLGDKTGPLDRRGEAFALQATAAFHFQEATDPLYKSIPFFIGFRAGTAYGILLDSTWRGYVDFGKQLRDTVSFGAEGGSADYYFLYGPEPKNVVTEYGWLTGTTPLPPLWVLGYQQSRHTYHPDSRVKEIADRLRADRIPADAIYLDIYFQDHNRPFTANPQEFPDMRGLVHYLTDRHLHTVVITDMHIPVLPGKNYLPYDTGIAGDHFIKNPDGSRYIGTVWPGPSMFPDFTRKVTRDWWGTLYQPFYAMGISGFWNDMNEPSVFNTLLRTIPSDVQHRIEEPGFKSRTTIHQELHNIYGMENSRATYEGLLNLKPTQRPFVLTRSTSAGGQRYAAVWTGDNSSTWNHLRLSTPMLLNLGLSGFSLAGDDIGGFAGSPSPELLTRWMEVGAFNPIDRNHTEDGTADQEPWAHGPLQEGIRRRYVEERYRLLPYLYTLAEENTRTGIPMMRPLFLEFPHVGVDQRPLDLDAGNEFMLGPALLVAPPPFGEMAGAYPLVLPTDTWFNYWTGEKVKSTSRSPYESPQINPKLDDLPVYVKPGSIIPLAPLTQSTDEVPVGPLELRVFPGKVCEGSLYLDDGKSFAYKEGKFLRLHFSCEQTQEGIHLSISARDGSYDPWWKQIKVSIYDWHFGSAKLRMNGIECPETPIVDSIGHKVTFLIDDQDTAQQIDLEN